MLNKNDRVIITSECQTKGYTGRVNKVFYCGDNLCASVRLDKLPPSEMKFQSYNVCNLELVDKKFTKEDLKPCMVVKLRNGDLKLIVDSRNGLSFNGDDNNYIKLSSYTYDLIYESYGGYDEFDIIEVYGLNYFQSLANKISKHNRDLLFRRTEPSARDIKIKELQDKMDELKREMEELK